MCVDGGEMLELLDGFPFVVWVALNGIGQVAGAYASEADARQNSRYVVACEVQQ